MPADTMDPATAVTYGPFIQAAEAQYSSDLGPVGQLEFGQGAADVPFDGTLGQDQPSGSSGADCAYMTFRIEIVRR